MTGALSQFSIMNNQKLFSGSNTVLTRRRAGFDAIQGHIQIQDLTIAYGRGKSCFIAVERVSLDIHPGQFVCLIGPSGCGKSTILNAIAGFVQPTDGTVQVDGQVIQTAGGDRGMVFQHPSLFPWKTVLENVAHGPRMAGKSRTQAHKLAKEFLEMVGLTSFANNYPATLSGGMQQRVAIARALVNYPRVLLMDEPFGALDAQMRILMQEQLLKLWEDFKTTVVFVTHDIDEAIFLGDRVAIMSANPGHILADLSVNLARPRHPELTLEPNFAELKRRCFDLVRQESLLVFERQSGKRL
ncbi:MAG: Bicarbonate transport ATP-binding protein CmpD [Chroococcidiopsis cubana SAG 39.79]|uniref:ABC-type quaternary amine transporter n=2 Tax=Chroococcidiopsis TaxID=54298 RepID=A0AB37UDX1_9CYAN|nr:Bicarbonate transport ATP-binding protein CmpD [Chroococcidiopsis cubana SAG 39.79]RUT07975.1 ABC transporter ATP-binding protein [Chroococcidiopsis cubana SAG 39.79]